MGGAAAAKKKASRASNFCEKRIEQIDDGCAHRVDGMKRWL